MVYKFVFKIGQHFRNPSLAGWFQFLKKSEKWSLQELEAYQLQKLKEIVQIAYQSSKYYKELFDKNGVAPEDINSLNDLVKLPIITKDELIKQNKDIHTHIHFKKTFQATTSGSTGESLKFVREEGADSFNRASIFRGYSWYNVKPWESNGYFWGFNFSKKEQLKIRLLDSLQNRFRLFNYKSNAIEVFVKKLKKASYLHGYSSMIYETARAINKYNFSKPSNLKMVKGTSEKIYDSYQKEIEKAYGLKIISEYGAAETGIIAFECKQGAMHINMEGVLVEEIDHEIVVTNLQMHSFPMIRYRLGDYIKLSDKTCTCGLQHQIIKEVTGRIGGVVYGKNSNYPSLFFYYIFKNIVKKHQLSLTYQVVQNEKGKLIFLIEQELSQKQEVLLTKEIKSYFTDDIDFVIKDKQKITSNNKKLKSFISAINE